MVSNQQNLNQVCIYHVLRTLRSLGVKKDTISGEPLIIMYSNVKSYITNQRHSTPTKYENEKKIMMRKTSARKVISIELIKTRKHHLQACNRKETAMFTNHRGASLTFYMFIILLNKLLLTISFIVFTL